MWEQGRYLHPINGHISYSISISMNYLYPINGHINTRKQCHAEPTSQIRYTDACISSAQCCDSNNHYIRLHNQSHIAVFSAIFAKQTKKCD